MLRLLGRLTQGRFTYRWKIFVWMVLGFECIDSVAKDPSSWNDEGCGKADLNCD